MNYSRSIEIILELERDIEFEDDNTIVSCYLDLDPTFHIQTTFAPNTAAALLK